MPIGRPKPVPILFPVNGIHRGEPAALQPDGTTHRAQNVRAYHGGDRRGGGKRAGTERAFATQAGSSGKRRVTHLAGFSQGGTIPSASGGTEVAESEDFTGLSNSHPTAQYPSHTRNGLLLFNSGTSTTTVREEQDTNARWTGSNAVLSTIMARLNLESGATKFGHLAASRWRTTNDVSLTAALQQQNNTTSDVPWPSGSGGTALMNGTGVFIRGDAKLEEFVAARITTTGTANEVEVEIVKKNSDGTFTSLATSAALPLPGSATYADDIVLTLAEVSDQLTATISSSTIYNLNVVTYAAWNPASPTTVTVNSSELSGEERAGFGIIHDSAKPSGRTLERYYKTFAYTAIKPSSPTVVHDMRPTVDNGTNQYQVPDALTSCYLDDSGGSGTLESLTGPQSATSQSGSFAVVPVIDTTNDDIVNTDEVTADETWFVAQTDAPSSRRGILSGLDPTTTEQNFVGFVTRVSDDFKSMVAVRPDPGASAEYEATYRSFTVRRPVANYIVSGSSSLTENAFGSLNSRIVIHRDDIVVWRDDGTQILLEVNGMSVGSYTMNTTQLALVDPSSDQKRTGFVTDQGQNSVESMGAAWIAVADASSINVGDVEATVAVYSEGGALQSGNLEEGTLSSFTGSAHTNPIIQTAYFAGKLYSVDGNRSKVADVGNLTVSDWVATSGTLPANTRLAATYRGRIVLARDDTNDRAWYMSRTFDPLDWDFNAEPLATAPYAGTVSAAGQSFGQPDNAIVALIPFLDDYLVFGCAGSMWMMEGDPGSGGSLQNMTRTVGIVGPRAWAFDHLGRLWFFGNGGLYCFPTIPGEPILVSENRLRTLLDRANLDMTLVQLSFDAFDKKLEIFLTPTDGTTQPEHVEYWLSRESPDPRAGSFFTKKMPTDHGPWSAIGVTGYEDQNRRVLMGGNDGWVRRHNDDILDDDGSAIECIVDSAPIMPFGNRVESKVVELNAELFEGSGEITWEWYTADSADEVRQLTSSPADTGTWGGTDSAGAIDTGFQEPQSMSERGGAHRLTITQNSSTAGFELDNLAAEFQAMSRRR